MILHLLDDTKVDFYFNTIENEKNMPFYIIHCMTQLYGVIVSSDLIFYYAADVTCTVAVGGTFWSDDS